MKILTALLLFASLYGIVRRGRAAPNLFASPARIPLTELGSGTYFDFEGGLYPNGKNTMPPAHAAVGEERRDLVRPLNMQGEPDSNGSIILLSIGMSNTSQEFCGQSEQTLDCNSWSFVGQASADPAVRQTGLALVNGAYPGHDAPYWDEPDDPDYDRIRDTLLAPRGLAEEQVQIVWLKSVRKVPERNLPDENADAYLLLHDLGRTVRALKSRYPNLQQVFLSSRTYAGYASTDLHPEPFAYETGFAVKWLIEAQIQQMAGSEPDPLAGDLNYTTVAPWLAWGPYLWADGMHIRSDGLYWTYDMFESDGIHPSTAGETLIAQLLLDFFKTNSHTSAWFLAPGAQAQSPALPLPAPEQLPETGEYCRTPDLPLPDEQTTVDFMNLYAPAILADLNVTINIRHPMPGDLAFELTHMDTRQSIILARRPGPWPNGCNVAGFQTFFDDGESKYIADSCREEPPGISGSFRPAEPLATFNNTQLWGTWRLEITDLQFFNSGTLSSWCLSWNIDAVPPEMAQPPAAGETAVPSPHLKKSPRLPGIFVKP